MQIYQGPTYSLDRLIFDSLLKALLGAFSSFLSFVLKLLLFRNISQLQYFKKTEKVKTAMKYSEYLKQNISVNLRWTCLDNNSDFLSNIRIGKFLTASIIFSEYENGFSPHSRFVHLLPCGLDTHFCLSFYTENFHLSSTNNFAA